MIEIRKPKKRFQIFIDGEHQHDTSVEHQLAKGGVDGYRINSRSWFFYESIQPYKISDFPNLIQLSFFLMVDWAKVKFWVSIIKSKNFDELYNVRFRVDVSKLKIDSEFSNYFKVFSSKIAELNENNNHFRIIITRLDDISFYLNFDKMPLSMTIGKELEYCLDILEDVHNRVLLTLDSKTQISTFTIGFDFPEKLKTSCEQYLQYFKQFLLDLGIQTSSELKDEAGKVLFSITPTEDIEALDKIREALAIYLNLPASPIVYDNSFAAMRLQQQIENLQHSQKMAVREVRVAERELQLAQTIIEQQDKLLGQKDSVIKKITSPTIMMDSLENKEELEELYEGLKIGESEFLKKQFGIHLNPAKVIKTAVKNTLGKDDEDKSILDLDEKEDK